MAFSFGEYVGSFEWCNPSVNLTSLRIAAFNGTNSSPVATGNFAAIHQFCWVRGFDSKRFRRNRLYPGGGELAKQHRAKGVAASSMSKSHPTTSKRRK